MIFNKGTRILFILIFLLVLGVGFFTAPVKGAVINCEAPTATPPPTATTVPPTATTVPPTATTVPPTATTLLQPTPITPTGTPVTATSTPTTEIVITSTSTPSIPKTGSESTPAPQKAPVTGGGAHLSPIMIVGIVLAGLLLYIVFFESDKHNRK